MKRPKLFLAAIAIAFTLNATAQDKNLFNHLSVAYTLGTDGLFGIDVASPIGDYVAVRAGYTFMPKFKADVDVDYNYNNQDWTSTIQGKLNMGNFKLLFDVYPIKNNSFHVTAGAYIGTSKLVEAASKGALEGIDPNDWGTAKVQISDNPENMFGTDPEGRVKGRATVNSFKPYLGVGFGRVVSNKFCNVSCDLGVQFWGTPKVEMYDYKAVYLPSEKPWKELKKSDFNDHDDDGYKALNTASKISVWPVLNVRVAFRAF